MLVNMLVKLFDHLWVVELEILLQAHRDAKQDHVSGLDNLAHLALDPLSQRVIEKLVSDAHSLALVERLKQVI